MTSPHLLYASIFYELCQSNPNFILKIADEVTYSSLMRQIGKKYSPDVLREFRIIYKKTFDAALIKGDEKPEDQALQAGLGFLDQLSSDHQKVATVIKIIKQADRLGNPSDVGLYLSDLVKFILRRINPTSRDKSLNNLRNKIMTLDENDIARKKMPPGASVGQSLVIIKHLLFGKDPSYVRQVLNSVAQNL